MKYQWKIRPYEFRKIFVSLVDEWTSECVHNVNNLVIFKQHSMSTQVCKLQTSRISKSVEEQF